MVPGHPIQGSLHLELGFGFPLPFHSGTYLVNNVPIARIGDITSGKTSPYFSGSLTPQALNAFHYGPNRLTIRADKAPLKKGEVCNTPRQLIGVLAQLSLKFEPDLEAVPSAMGREQAVRKSAGQVVGALGNIGFVNHGPSGSPGGTVVFSIGGNVFVQTAWSHDTVRASPPFTECKGEGSGVSVVGTITCTYGNFPAGLKTSLFVVVAGRLTPNFPRDPTTSLEVAWTVTPAGGADFNGANNSYSHKFIICGPAAKKPECQNAN